MELGEGPVEIGSVENILIVLGSNDVPAMKVPEEWAVTAAVSVGGGMAPGTLAIIIMGEVREDAVVGGWCVREGVEESEKTASEPPESGSGNGVVGGRGEELGEDFLEEQDGGAGGPGEGDPTGW